jgi:hypothetical protein
MDTCAYEGFVDLRQPPPNQPGVVEHAAKLAPLVEASHLDEIEACLKQALQAAECKHYRDRVARQLPLWRFARRETQTIYKGLRAVPVVSRALDSGSTIEQRAEAIEMIEGVTRGVDAGTAILDSIPEEWKGSFVRRDNGAYRERLGMYKQTWYRWLTQLKERQP